MARTAKKEVPVSLETVLWNCRVALRGVGTTEKNRDAVIGLVFLKFAGDKFEKRRMEIREQFPQFLEKPAFYNAENVFYLEETARWPHIVQNASANDIALILDRAMEDIERSNPALNGALTRNLFTSLGADKSKIKELIDSVNQIDERRFREEDLIGRVYEYFLQIYAASGTKEDGEFYTPASVVQLMAELIEPYSGTVYDPCCGSGGMFVQSLKFVDRHHGNRQKVSIIGQERSPETCHDEMESFATYMKLGFRSFEFLTVDGQKQLEVSQQQNIQFNETRGIINEPTNVILSMIFKVTDLKRDIADFFQDEGLTYIDQAHHVILYEQVKDSPKEKKIAGPRSVPVAQYKQYADSPELSPLNDCITDESGRLICFGYECKMSADKVFKDRKHYKFAIEKLCQSEAYKTFLILKNYYEELADRYKEEEL